VLKLDKDEPQHQKSKAEIQQRTAPTKRGFSMEENFHRRCRRIAIIAGAALLLLGASPTPPRTAPFYDYSAMLKILSDSATLRYPTAEELKAFPVLWPTVPVEENAAFYYAKAVRLVKRDGDPPGSGGSADTYAGDLAALEAWVAANKPAFDMAARAQAHPVCRMPIFISTANGWARANGYPNPCPNCLASLRQLGRCFGDAGLAEELNGRPHDAAKWYLTCLRMGAQARHGVTIQSLVGCAICSIGATALDRLVANAALPEDDLRKIIQACAEAETRPGEIADSLECEAEYDAAYLHVGGLRAKIAKEILDIVHGDSRAVAAARKDAELPIYEVINSPAAQLALQPGAKSDEVLSDFWEWRVNLGRMDTQLRVLQIRSAIALYQKQHGKLPDTLDALCPQFLPKVPLDPFSGKPLRYRFTKEGWLVWSVGPDLKDDGGSEDEKYMAAIGSNWHGKDGVFISGVESTVKRIRSRTTFSMSYSPEAEAAAEAAAKVAPPDVDRLGLTALHRAANRGDLAVVEALLAKGADVNARALAKQTPLHLAVTKEIAQLLISKGAQVEARDRWGRTPLFWAAGAGRKEVVQALLAAGAQADAPGLTDTVLNAMMSQLRAQLPAKMQASIPADQSPRTPITYAAEQGHEDIAELLRKHLTEHPRKQ